MSLSAVAGYVLRVLFGMFPYVVFLGETRLSAEHPASLAPDQGCPKCKLSAIPESSAGRWLGCTSIIESCALGLPSLKLDTPDSVAIIFTNELKCEIVWAFPVGNIKHVEIERHLPGF